MTTRNGRSPLIGSLLLCGATLCVALPTWAGEAAPPYVDSALVKRWLGQGRPVTFLDVREPDEFAAGHLEGGINVVYDAVASLVDRLPHDQPIIVYCIHSTHRAPEAAKTLQILGFTNTYVLEGGITAWQSGGQLILASDPQRAPAILPYTERCRDKSTPKL